MYKNLSFQKSEINLENLEKKTFGHPAVARMSHRLVLRYFCKLIFKAF